MKFEYFLNTHISNHKSSFKRQQTHFLWSFDCFEVEKIDLEGPVLCFETFKKIESKQKLYSYQNSNLMKYARHKKVIFYDKYGGEKIWEFQMQNTNILTLKEGEKRIFPYGGYYKKGCALEEIEQIFFTIQFFEGEVIPFLFRSSEVSV